MRRRRIGLALGTAGVALLVLAAFLLGGELAVEHARTDLLNDLARSKMEDGVTPALWYFYKPPDETWPYVIIAILGVAGLVSVVAGLRLLLRPLTPDEPTPATADQG